MTALDPTLHQWVELAWTFPVLRRYLIQVDLDPRLGRYVAGRGAILDFDEVVSKGGGKAAVQAAALVLELWSRVPYPAIPNVNGWRVGRFSIRDALAAWDPEQRAAFSAWAQAPRGF